MNAIKEAQLKVIAYLKAKGPSLPVELTKVIGFDTLTSNAILSSLVKNKLIYRTHRKIGSSYIYYLEGQEEFARRRIYETLSEREKALINKVKREIVIFDNNLSQEERKILEDLLDFVIPIEVKSKDQTYLAWKYYSATNGEVKEKISQILSEIEKMKGEELKAEAYQQSKAVVDPNEKIRSFLERIGAKIIESNLKKKESEYLVEIPTAPTSSKLLIKFKDKKSVDEKDMSLLYAEVLKRKLPILFIISGKLTRSAEKFKEKNLGELVKVFKLDDL